MEETATSAAAKLPEESESLNQADPTTVAEQLHEAGWARVPNVLTSNLVSHFRGLVDVARAGEHDAHVANSSGTYGLRNLTDVVPEVSQLVQHPPVTQIVRSVIGPNAFVVRATLFDKTPGANWGVFWHQDLSIAVQQRHDVAGFTAWTVKAGVQCVQPPIELMQKILTVRLHLDDCSADNGALRVLPGTHQAGRFSSVQAEQRRASTAEVICEIPAGGAIVMRPLLLHASSPMNVETSRRVIHFEFAAFELPAPLDWRFRIGIA